MKTNYTVDEVAELLAAYKLSNSGTHVVSEIKLKYPESFQMLFDGTLEWLAENNKSIEERAAEWFSTCSKDYQNILKNNTKEKTILHIYKEQILKIYK